jgi:FAD/FMN-containing dehydrogenase
MKLKICSLMGVMLLGGWGFLQATETVNDVSRLNPVVVQQVIAPRTTDEVIAAVRTHAGPIAIGGGRYSMGGQTAVAKGIQLDMRQLNHLVAFDPAHKEITVQAGMTWRAVQEIIDPYNLSVSIMQTYNNFTVGGSLSVNAHGRYMGSGPLVSSVRRIHLVLADGTLLEAGPTEHADLFYGALGGYGSLGVIVDATLALADNVKVERQSIVMPLKDYPAYFATHIKVHPEVVFHNADLYPNDFDQVRATSYLRTDKPLTIQDRLIPLDQSYAERRWAFRIIADWPGGKFLRQYLIDPWIFSGTCVEWRNHEASYRVEELEPISREQSTYVLEEYFVPEDRLEPFVERMRAVLQQHRVNAINVSIRHAQRDPGTYLAWAKTDVYALVLYYKQGTTPAEQQEVGIWTRALIDAALAEQGSYYLPYQVWATPRQFFAAYPLAPKLFALKHAVDPTHKFQNRLLDAYDPD